MFKAKNEALQTDSDVQKWAMGNSKIICICGSTVFIDEMESLAAELSDVGYQVHAPVREEASFDWDDLGDDQKFALKREYISGYLETIKRSDVVLIANYTKNGVEGYIGANSLMEAAFAFALDIPVAYLVAVGEQPCQLEALSISRCVVAHDLETHSLARIYLCWL